MEVNGVSLKKSSQEEACKALRVSGGNIYWLITTEIEVTGH